MLKTSLISLTSEERRTRPHMNVNIGGGPKQQTDPLVLGDCRDVWLGSARQLSDGDFDAQAEYRR